ncbi:DNA-binding transcriptional LysR family regulator [Paraburkholderia sp. UCT70]
MTLNSDAGSHSVVERALSTHCVRGRPIQELGHVAAVLRMIELGLGVGVLPVDEHWPAPSERLVSLPLLPEVMLTTMQVRRRNRSLKPNAAAAWAQFAGAGASTAQSVDELWASANGQMPATSLNAP